MLVGTKVRHIVTQQAGVVIGVPASTIPETVTVMYNKIGPRPNQPVVSLLTTSTPFAPQVKPKPIETASPASAVHPNTAKHCSQHHTYFPGESPYVPVSWFGKKKGTPDGLLDHCKACKQKLNARPKGNDARRAGINPATGKWQNYIGQLVDGLWRYTKDICLALNIPHEFGPVPEGLQLYETEPTFENTTAFAAAAAN